MFASFLEFALAVFCMYVYMYHTIHILIAYVGSGHVEIVDVKVFIDEERSQMKVTLRKVRLLL